MVKELCELVVKYKKLEDNFKKLKNESESKIIEYFKTKKEEGSSTYDKDGYKVTITNSISRKIIKEEYLLIKEKDDYNDIVEESLKLSLKKYRELEKENPLKFKEFSRCVEEKPSKSAVKIKKIEEE